MAKNIHRALEVLHLAGDLMPASWKIQVTVPPDEVDGVWPELHQYLTEQFEKKGITPDFPTVTIVPGETEVVEGSFSDA